MTSEEGGARIRANGESGGNTSEGTTQEEDETFQTQKERKVTENKMEAEGDNC